VDRERVIDLDQGTVVDDDPASLAGVVLDEEARRLADQAARAEVVVLPDDLLPGVGAEPMGLREAMRKGGSRTLVVLTLLHFVDELDRVALSVLAPDIQDTIGISDTVLGAIAGSAGAMFVLGAVPMGTLADRMPRKYLAAIATVIWSVVVFLTSFVRNPLQLFVCRAATGIGQSNVLPVHNALLADTYPIPARGRVFGVHGAMLPAGRVFGPLVLGGIAAAAGGVAGWRWAFGIVAIPSLVLAILALTIKEPPRGQHEQMAVLGEVLERGDELPVSMSMAFQRLRKIRTFYYVLVGVGTLGFALTSIPIFVSLYLEEEYGYDAFERGVVLSIVNIGPLIGAPIAGAYADKLFRRSPVKLLMLTATMVSTYGILVITGLYMPNIVLLVAVMMLGYTGAFAGFLTLPPTVSAVVPYRLRSQGFAMVGVYIFLLGAFGGAVITGQLSDAFGERTALTIVAPPATLLGGALIAYGARHVRRDISLVVEELREEQEEMARIKEDPDHVPVLQVRNLDFSYGPVQVLFDVELEVHKGEVLALLGTNGAGKSTVLRVISGLGTAERGVVRLDGHTVTYVDAELRFRAGVVQLRGGGGVFSELTVAENLKAAIMQAKLDRAEVRRRTEHVLEVFPQLRSRLDDRASELSGGQQQMLALGMCLLHEPEVLIIDELSLGLAPIVVQELLGVVERLKQEGVTMIIVEQSLNVALAIADRAVFMEKGRVRFQGPARELAERDDLVRAVFLGGEGG
jgi:ABC-type branched-subunit amino acid transport system ATPase component/sugar phosphate permease